MKPKNENTSYDLQVLRNGRWATETRLTDEAEARAAAAARVADAKCEGARVLRNWLRADGTEMELEIFCKTQQVKDDGVVRIDPIETAPDRCASLQDYFSLGSRLLMSRVFHTYLEKVTLTATEILHNARELKRLQDKDALVASAVDRVATLQARAGNLEAKARKDELFKTVEQIIARARKLEAVTLPKPGESFAGMVKALPAAANQADRDYLALTALCRDLAAARSFAGKLERVCKLAVGVEDPAQLALLDELIAELLETSVVQDVLGWQAGLGHAICSLLDLADGTMAIDKSEAADAARLLNTLFAERRLPVSRAGLIDRAHRQIESVSPLYRNDPQQEYGAFKKVLLRMLTPTGLHSGPATAQALTHRYLRLLKRGGMEGRRDVIGGIVRAMPDYAYGILYLCELARSDFAADTSEIMAEILLQTVGGEHLGDLVQAGLSPKDRMVRATTAFRAAADSPYPPAIRQQVTDHIDTMIDEYLIAEQIIEKLDHPSSTLRDRATRLVQFCAAGVLPEGKALTRARERIRAILRQPNFDAHFVEGIADPAKAQKALRDFHQLLINKAGFGG